MSAKCLDTCRYSLIEILKIKRVVCRERCLDNYKMIS